MDIPAAITVLAAVAVYSNSLHGAFVFDDLPAVVDNADVDASKTGWSIRRLSHADV